MTWNNVHKTLIYLEATEKEIHEMKKYFNKINKTYSDFNEPDLGGLLTACCFEPLPSDEGKIIFGKFKLLA
jgi:hypothetical protein